MSSNPPPSPEPKSSRELSAAKQALLERRLAKLRNSSTTPAIARVGFSQNTPLSFGQERMWFLDQFEPGNIAYNRPTVLEFRGELDPAVLQQVLRETLQRHQVLRTVYRQVNGRPIQILLEPDSFQLHQLDLRALKLPAAELADEARRLASEEIRYAFNLHEDLLFRAKLIRLEDKRHWLILATHHIAFDGGSQPILQNELATLYRAIQEGGPSPLSELPVQYCDYANWQRQWAAGPEALRQLRWWQETLKSAPKVLELPSDYPRPAVQSVRGEQLPVRLSPSLTKSLRDLAARNESTLFMVLMAAWNLLLYRYTGQEDILIGFPISGRTRSETQSLIGLFINSLPLRTDLSGNPPFLELLRRVREALLATYANQEVPLQLLIENLQVPRDTSRAPLFQHMLALQNAPSTTTNLGDLVFEPLRIDSPTAKLDLTLDLREYPDRLEGYLEYSTDLFNRQTIERLLGHFVSLLENLVEDPSQPISQLRLLTDAERQQLLVEWNDTSVEYPKDRCVHELFEEQVLRTPDAIALVVRDKPVTYRELNEQSNQFAHYLMGIGVLPGAHIGICVDRSEQLIVGILGTLKAGAAYVPLDVEYPTQRLEFMLRDAGVHFIVTLNQHEERIPSLDCTHICLNAKDLNQRNLPRSNPSLKLDAENIAYVLYTSGSTGVPKGVGIRHRSILRLVFGNNYATFGPDKVFVHLANPAFDASTFELWGALLHGARLVVATDRVPDFYQIEELLQTNGVTTLWLTSSFLNQLIEHHPQALRGVKEILTGGEALSVPHVAKGQKFLGPSVQWINGYGPTESTTFTTCFRIPFGVSTLQSSIPIGRPIANTQVYVLDSYQEPVPIGVAGELYIGGDGLASGYLNRTELSAEKFVKNPFSQNSASTLYRTGDLVRWRPDANLEFLGRIDNQIKLRGFRIEMGEIEAVLNGNPEIAQCAVILREDRPGDKRLAAYCVPAKGFRLNISNLKKFLQDRLPDYMVPSAIVELEAFPLTANGKLDWRSLPTPEHTRPDLENNFALPRNQIEEKLALIWSELLGIQRIGIHDNFFALGGHSLLAVRLLARIESSFGRRLPLAILFQNGTIDHVAKLLAEPPGESGVASVIPLQTTTRGRTLFFMPMLGGGATVSQALLKQLDGCFPIAGLQLDLTTKNVEQFKDFRATANQLVVAIRKYQPNGPYALSGFSIGGMMAYEVACQLTQAGETVDRLIVIDTGPYLRGLQLRWTDRGSAFARLIANVPAWIQEEFHTISAKELASRIGRKVRQLYRKLASRGQAELQMDDVLDLGQIQLQNPRLSQALYNGLQNYLPLPYSGKLTLLRAHVGPLLRVRTIDLGWNRFVSQLEVRHIPGNHQSILKPPHVHELAKQLVELMDEKSW